MGVYGCIRDVYKLVRENAVTRAHESCALRVIGSCRGPF